jgi:hypothetical protein
MSNEDHVMKTPMTEQCEVIEETATVPPRNDFTLLMTLHYYFFTWSIIACVSGSSL